MRRLVGVAVVGVLALGLACSGPADEDEEVAPDETTTIVEDAAEACLLSPGTVGAALGGGRTVAAGPAMGGSSGDVGDGAFAVNWVGCSYTGPDDVAVTVAELVDDQGEPDLGGYEQLVAAAEESGPDVAGLGDDALVADTELVVRTADATLLLGLGSGAEPTADDLSTLADVGRAVVDEGTGDVAALCRALPAMVPEVWATAGEPVASTGDGLAAGLEYTYDICTVPLLDGDAELNVGVAAPDVYEARAAAEGPPDDLAVVVDGVGDGAVQYEGRIYVQVGPRGAMAEGESPGGEPLSGATLLALGEAAADALA